MSDIVPSVDSTEEKEAALMKMKNWKTLGVQLEFVFFVRVAGNKWFGNDLWHVKPDGLNCTKIEGDLESVRTVKPFSIMDKVIDEHAIQRQLFYFEVTVKELGSQMWIGMSIRDFPDDKHVGTAPGSFALENDGYFWIAGKYSCKEKAERFSKNDVIGCGLLLVSKGRRRIFFTKNGQLYGTPFLTTDVDNELYPTVSSDFAYDALEANFGETLEQRKAFRFDLSGINLIDG